MKIIITVVLVACIQACQGGEARDYEMCNEKPMKLEVDQKQKIDKCLKEAGAKNLKDIKDEKRACFVKCKLTAFDELNEDGTPWLDKIAQRVRKIYPDEIMEKASDKAVGCLDAHFRTKDAKNYKDASCSGYASLAKCIKEARKEVCG